MTKVIRAEIYKLFHSFYLWGIGLGYLLVTTILVHDHIDEMSYLRSGMYPIPFMLFFIIALAIVMIGNEFDQRQLQDLIAEPERVRQRRPRFAVCILRLYLKNPVHLFPSSVSYASYLSLMRAFMASQASGCST